DGTFLGYIGSCTDVHELRETQNELRRRALEVVHLNRTATAGALSASIAHELNQPLTAIQSNTDAAKSLLAARFSDLAEVKEILIDIGEDARRAASIIHHLRLLLKRRSEAEVQQFDLNGAIADMLLILRPEMMKRRIGLSVEGNEQSLPVRIDKILLEQVLL